MPKKLRVDGFFCGKLRDGSTKITVSQNGIGSAATDTYITKNVNGTEYSVRYTGGSGTKPGWVAQAKTSTREFTLYEVVEVSEPETEVPFGLEKLTPDTDGLLTLEAGERYVFVTEVSGTKYALSSSTNILYIRSAKRIIRLR